MIMNTDNRSAQNAEEPPFVQGLIIGAFEQSGAWLHATLRSANQRLLIWCWGLGAAGLFLGGARATGGRAGAVAPAAGWMISVVLLTSTRPEGDFLFGAGAGSYLFLLGGMAVAVMCATLVRGRQPTGSDARLGK